MNERPDTALPGWAWLGLPLVIYFSHYLARALLDFAVYDRWVLHESGITEKATLVMLALALVGGLLATRWAWRQGDRKLVAFFLVFCLGCVYFGGEEASWGQHMAGWSAPEEWAEVNDQAETNLHNTSGIAGTLLDQLPRNLLAIAMLVGGAILPLVRRARGLRHSLHSFRGLIMPGFECVAIGFIAPLASIPEKVLETVAGTVPEPLAIEAGEVKELMFAVFLAVYIAGVLGRMRRAGAAAPSPR